MEQNAMAALEVALALIPEHEKIDYVRAVAVAPDLVATESDPIKFLRFTSFNAAAAALAIVRYWKGRKEIFGESAVLPFSLTGDGALDQSVLDIVRSGVSLTPITDRNGRPILIYDVSRRVTQDPGPRNKYLFYVFHYLMENNLSLTDGYVFITLGNMRFNIATHHTLTIVRDSFPIKLHAWHFVTYTPNQRKQHVFSAKLKMFLLHVYSRFLRGSSLFVHDVCTKEALVKALDAHGIDKSQLPSALGGDWSYWQVQQWFLDRKKRDQERYGRLPYTKNEIYPTRSVTWARSESFILPSAARSETMELLSYTKSPASSCLESHLPINQELALGKAIHAWGNPKEFSVECSSESEIVKYFSRQLSMGILDLRKAEALAYLEASVNAPDYVWEEECNPFSFLLAEDFNIFLAAKRMARYWELRVDSFPDRKYEAINQTGEGALQRRTDILLLESGFVSLLPHDDAECSVIYIDATCLQKAHRVERQKRCLFYVFSVAAENLKSQQYGISVIIRSTSSKPSLLGGIDIAFLERLTDSLPVNIKDVHILHEEMDVHDEVEINMNLGGRLHIHKIKSKDEALFNLQKFGFRKDGLPRCVNGTLGVGQLKLWQELRARVEWRIPLGLSGRDIQDFPGMKLYDILQDKDERERRLAIIHSRRKRDRSNVDQVLLEERVADTKEENKRLHREHQKLASLLSQAVTMSCSL